MDLSQKKIQSPDAAINLLVQCERLSPEVGAPVLEQIAGTPVFKNTLVKAKMVRCLSRWGDGVHQRGIILRMLNTEQAEPSDSRLNAEWLLLVNSRNAGSIPALLMLCTYTPSVVIDEIVKRYALAEDGARYGQMVAFRRTLLDQMSEFSRFIGWQNEYSAAIFGAMCYKHKDLLEDLIQNSTELPRTIVEIIQSAIDNVDDYRIEELAEKFEKATGWWSRPEKYIQIHKTADEIIRYLFSRWGTNVDRMRMLDLSIAGLPVGELVKVLTAVCKGKNRVLFGRMIEIIHSGRLSDHEKWIVRNLTANNLSVQFQQPLSQAIVERHLDQYVSQGFANLMNKRPPQIKLQRPTFASWYQRNEIVQEAGWRGNLVSILAAFLAIMPMDLAVMRALKASGGNANNPREVQMAKELAVKLQAQKAAQTPAQPVAAPPASIPTNKPPAPSPAPVESKPSTQSVVTEPAKTEPAKTEPAKTTRKPVNIPANVREFLNILRQVETGGQPNNGEGAIGDRGEALGPYQIHFEYWWDTDVDGDYRECAGLQYSERVVMSYLKKHCPGALAKGDWETMAKTHHSISGKGNDVYWNNFKKTALRMGYHMVKGRLVKSEHHGEIKTAAKTPKTPKYLQDARNVFENHLNRMGIKDQITYKVKPFTASHDKDTLAKYRGNSQFRSRPTFWVNERFPEIAQRAIDDLNREFGSQTSSPFEMQNAMVDTLMHEYAHVIYEMAISAEWYYPDQPRSREFSNLVLSKYPYHPGDEKNSNSPMERFCEDFMDWGRNGIYVEDPNYFEQVVTMYRNLAFMMWTGENPLVFSQGDESVRCLKNR